MSVESGMKSMQERWARENCDREVRQAEAFRRDTNMTTAALAKAMAKAGLGGAKFWIYWTSEHTDPWANYAGYMVVAETEELAARVGAWLARWEATRSKSTCGGYVSKRPAPEGLAAIFMPIFRYSLGD